MTINDQVRSQIESALDSAKVVLFMKGTREQPQCGFSATVVGILEKLGPDYATIDVLEDGDIREGIKAHSDWPTIPQLYVNKEFIGGCDIIKQMFNTGDLHKTLGVQPPDRTPPKIQISDTAVQVIKEALEEQPGVGVHLNIDAEWNHQFSLVPPEGHEIKAEANGVELLFDIDSAQRANGLIIDMADTAEGQGFSIENPNAPPPVKQMDVNDLKNKLDAGEKLHLFDVRSIDEHERARIKGARLLDNESVNFINSLPKDDALVFHCHHGPRSQSAAEHFRQQGFTNVHNVVGGIDAWSVHVDPTVPRY